MNSVLLTFVLSFILVESNNQSKNHYDDYGYKIVDNVGSFKLHTNLATWDEAKQICVSEDANLAVLNSQEEANILMDLWNEALPVNPRFYHPVGKYVYLGIHDRNNEGEFETIFHEQLNSTGFAVWSHGEPNSYMGMDEDCGTLDVRVRSLNDINCEEKLRFLCEKQQDIFYPSVAAE